MEFEHIYNGECKCCDADISCIDIDTVEVQAAVGYKFKLNGKSISLTQIREFLASNGMSSSTKTNTPTQETLVATARKVRSIRCLNNNKIYKNMSEAGKDLGIDSAQISYSLKVGRPTKGYSFEFVEQ